LSDIQTKFEKVFVAVI